MMKPRRASTQLNDLPDGLLVKCFACLEQKDRLRNVSRISRRFCELCNAPELLHTVTVSTLEGAHFHGESLLPWLASRAPHIHHLTFKLTDQLGSNARYATIAGCLAAIGVAGRLQELGLDLQSAGVCPPMPALDWLPTMRTLKRLSLSAPDEQDLRLPRGVSLLTNLVSISLHGTAVVFEGAAPTSLTALEALVRGDGVTGPPLVLPQLGSLPQLARVTLHIDVRRRYVHNNDAVLQELATLSSLSYLDLMVHTLPIAVSSLTSLKHLRLVGGFVHGEDEAVDLILHPLQRLVSLVIGVADLPFVPTALGTLSQLQRCLFYTSYAPDGRDDRQLPGGQWLSSLRCLEAPGNVLINSWEMLAAAEQLEYVCITNGPYPVCLSRAHWQAFWHWAATHRPLRRFTVNAEDTVHLHGFVLEEIIKLARTRPQLDVFADGAKQDGWPGARMCFEHEIDSLN